MKKTPIAEALSGWLPKKPDPVPEKKAEPVPLAVAPRRRITFILRGRPQ